MALRRHRLYLSAAPLIAAGYLLLEFASHDTHSRFVAALVVGCIFGTLFGQTALAAAWAAFGPAPLLWRLPLSLIWIALLCIDWESNLKMQARGSEGAGGVMAVCLFAQWLAMQIPCWLLVLFGVRLQQKDDRVEPLRGRGGQFSLGQLIVLMAIVGVGINLGRVLAPAVIQGFGRVGEWPMYRTLALVAILTTLPLTLAALLPRRSAAATLLALIWIGVATFWELPVLKYLGGDGPKWVDLAWTNAVSACWILAFALAVRLSGYRLTIVDRNQRRMDRQSAATAR